MVISDQKLKMPKRWEKLLYEHTRVVMCKKSAQKDTKYSENECILKMAKIGRDEKAIAFAKWSVWVKN